MPDLAHAMTTNPLLKVQINAGYFDLLTPYFEGKYEMRHLLEANFDTTHYTYFVYVDADFPDETIPKGLAAEGLGNLTGLCGESPNSYMGRAGHALGHAFGLPEVSIENPEALMSTGFPNYPNCILQQPEKDSLNASPFF